MSPKRTSNENAMAIQTPAKDDSDRLHGGSLRSKLVLSLAAMFFVFLGVDNLVRHRFLRPAFTALEHTHAVENAARVLSAVDTEKRLLGVLASQLAGQWQHRDSDSKDLVVSQAVATEVSSVHVLTPDGHSKTVFTRGTDDGTGPQPQTLSDVLRGLLVQPQGETITDVLRLPNGDLTLVAAAKVPSVGDDNTLGSENASDHATAGETVVVLRRIDPALVNLINGNTKVRFTLQAPHPNDDRSPLQLWQADASTFVVEFPLKNASGTSIANVFVQLPRQSMMRAYQATRTARNQFVFGSVAALLLLLLLLQRIVIAPLQNLRQRTDRIAEQGLHAGPALKHSNDEIGNLGSAFDHMVLRLRQTQVAMSKSSRAAGMSQVASTVVHNIGNVLTNVNSLLETINQKVNDLRVEPLGSLANRLRDPDVDKELADQAPEYLHGLSQSLRSDRDELVEMLGVLQGNIAHIHDVIREQRQHTGADSVSQTAVVEDLLQEAIRCCEERMKQSDVHVYVAGDLDTELQTDSSVLLQVFINLIANAQVAFEDSSTDHRQLAITVKKFDDTVRMRFTDNASGMCEDTLKRLFEAHYTTRADGTGLGLHFCSLSIARLGGRIEASSQGIGHGSVLTIWLPIQLESEIDSADRVEDPSDHKILVGTA